MSPEDSLKREARRLGAYLHGIPPSSAVSAAYCDPRAQAYVGEASDAFDRVLLRWAMLGAFAARGADAYARFLRPNAWFRRKLVLLMALTEVRDPDAGFFRTPTAGGLVGFVLGSLARGITTGLALLIALPILSACHLSLGQRG